MAVPTGLLIRCFYLYSTCLLLHIVACYLAARWLTGPIWALTVISTVYIAYISYLQVDVKGRAVLITGCSSGFGLHLTKALHALGFVIFAGFHDARGSSADHLRSIGQSSGRLFVVQLDVTDAEQIRSAVRFVNDHLPPKGLWALVNNAGVAVLGGAEWIPPSTYDRVLAVNLNGTVQTTLAFLPTLRKFGGRVINVTSGGGRIGLLYHGPYVASKFGVEGFSDVLRNEMRPLGVKVIVVEPGNYIGGTNIFRQRQVGDDIAQLWNQMDPDVRAGYDQRHLDACISLCQGFVRSGSSDIDPVVNILTDAVIRLHPLRRYVAGNITCKLFIFIWTHFPEFVSDYLMETQASILIKGT